MSVSIRSILSDRELLILMRYYISDFFLMLYGETDIMGLDFQADHGDPLSLTKHM
jgi:hypothetical protein